MEYSRGAWTLEPQNEGRDLIDAGWAQLVTRSTDEDDCITLTDSDLIEVEPIG